MNEDTRQLDLALAECEQENRLLRARNERLEKELAHVKMLHDVLSMASDPAGLKQRGKLNVAIPNT